MGAHRMRQLLPEFEYNMEPPAGPSEAARHRTGMLDAEERVSHWEEVETGLTPVEATEECLRCLRCDIRGNGH
jgi:hypothetical protein